MKKVSAKAVKEDDNGMRAEYDFRGGVRGKHYKAMQTGYTITIHGVDGTTVVKNVKPAEGAVILEPDVRAYFPNSASVNKTLRSLITLVPMRRKAVVRKARSVGTRRRGARGSRSKSAG